MPLDSPPLVIASIRLMAWQLGVGDLPRRAEGLLTSPVISHLLTSRQTPVPGFPTVTFSNPEEDTAEHGARAVVEWPRATSARASVGQAGEDPLRARQTQA